MDVTEFFTVSLPHFFAQIPHHGVTPQELFISLLFSMAGTGLIINSTGVKYWLDPIPYFLSLFIGAYLAHCFLGGIEIPELSGLHQNMVVTLAGMTLGTFGIMYYLRPDTDRPTR